MRASPRAVKLLPCLLLLLAGCASNPVTTQPEGDKQAVDKPLPFVEPEPPAGELDSELVFSALAGEIATQRGRLNQAYQYQLQTAVLAGDAVAAQRATRIAILSKQPQQALKAVQVWVKLAPNELAGRQLAASLLLESGQRQPALEQLQAIVAISEAKGDDGFLNAMAALSKQQDRERALEVVRQLGSGYPQDPRAGYALALMALMWSDYSLAETEIRKVIERHPDWNKSHILLSRLYVARGDKAAARGVLQQAVEQQPDDALLRNAYARLLVDAEDYQGAYRQFRELQRLQPENTDVQYSLGVLALQLERTRDARKHFQQLLETGQRANEVAYYLGRVEQMAGHWTESVRWYKKVEGGEFHDDARIRVARSLARAGRLAEAQDWLRGLRVQLPDQSVPLFVVEADILARQGSQEQVMAVYAKALSHHPGNEDLLYARALYAATIDRVDILEADLRQVLAKNPDNADALNALGYTLADQTTRYQEALELISRALALKPESAAVLDSMGWVQFRLGRYEQALGYLRRAFAAMPDSEIAAHLGEVLWVSGDKPQARRVWRQMLKQDPDSSHVRETMQRLDP